MDKSNRFCWVKTKHNKTFLLPWILALVCTVFAQAALAQAANLKEIRFAGLEGNKVQIELALDGEPGLLKSFSTENPARIAIDLPGIANKAGKKSIPINIGKAISIRALQAGDRTRVVLNLSESVPYATKIEGNSVFITLNRTKALSKAISSASTATGVASSGSLAVKNVDFRRGEQGEGRVLISLNAANAIVDVKEQGGKIIVDIKNAQLPAKFANKLDVLDFATPVKTIDVKRQGDNTRLTVTPVGLYEFLSYQMDGLLTLEFKPLTRQEKATLIADKNRYTGEKLSLNFQSIEVRSVLQLLADFTDMNLVASDSVGGSVTLRLNNVPWDQALEIILKSKGLAKRVTGNVLMVGPIAEIAAQEKLELESKKQVKELSPLVSEFIEISYAKAADIATLLQSADNTLLSTRGGVTIDDRTNTLLVQETVEKLAEIRKIIQRLDRPVRQVMIESRIVIANDDFTRDLGVRFGLSSIDRHGDHITLGAGGLPGNVSPGGSGPIFTTVGGTTENLLVDLPAASPAGAIQFLVGKIGSSLLQLELSALQTEAKGEVISSPRVITADQSEAIINQGVEIPFQEASSSGATTTSFKEAELRLTVTPQITPDDRINMKLDISKDAPDFSNVQAGGVPINTQGVQTTVLVNNGDTVILGGIYERSKDSSIRKVPFFGDLPGVGVLFRKTFKQDNSRELLFFITPKILKDGNVVN
ncbi:MAG: pilus assembly protein PilQ [Piscirickettsiaceae bacterium]|nr:MAG: pilus assembly protein PilQ [Piscirickettsiaceae bacterium]